MRCQCNIAKRFQDFNETVAMTFQDLIYLHREFQFDFKITLQILIRLQGYIEASIFR